jgi:hypothetical protein
MPDNFGPVYEVTHCVDREVVGEFDTWLAQHIEEMLELPGIIRASSYAADEDELGRPRRVTLYYFDSDSDLDAYLAGPAAAMRQSSEDLFAGKFDVVRRTLHETAVIDETLTTAESCLNCGTALTGQYCGECGQRARSRLISIWELIQEAFGDLLELDSRLWRTLIPLAFRPGRLTRDYLEGRRARFMPPFRTYLVLSIVFFVVVFFDPREEFGIFFDPEEDVPEVTDEEGNIAEEIRGEVLQDLVNDGVISADQAATMLPAGTEITEEESPQSDGEDNADEDDNDGISIRINDDETATSSNCDDIETDDFPPWLSARLTPERLKAACERIVADEGKTYLSKLLDSVPAALIALLPIMALVLKMLYPLSKRYYVEHVLFVVHYHAFFFLILTLHTLFLRFASLLSLPDSVSAITTLAISIYIMVYLFKSMRLVYDQGRLISFTKYLVLVVAYLVGLVFVLAITGILAALSI